MSLGVGMVWRGSDKCLESGFYIAFGLWEIERVGGN
jgi:hypothetical protein